MTLLHRNTPQGWKSYDKGVEMCGSFGSEGEDGTNRH